MATDGLPSNPCIYEDISWCHSVGWFTFEDLQTYKFTDELWNECGDCLELLYDLLKYFDDRFECRCVVWYDN